ncbi:hypothetical protein [Halocalculus aciditolerans]|uniref:SCP2 domain-containing protein n=1 Tax=Halocalculus aciditolerans TaxID=1383812 RepID=A0A830FE33_9EURY|nr:hypothetical protein [Halocalculus aciditolerans]GGL66028.1 hypothetical protein GCM10009039_24910 [Halocalculus aciditolerans]
MTSILDTQDWPQELANAASSDEFRRSATEFDGSLALEVGSDTAWFKIYRGHVIDTEPYVPSFGATFRVIGDDKAWRRVASGDQSLSGAIHTGSLKTAGNKLEANRMREMLELLIRTLQDLDEAIDD